MNFLTKILCMLLLGASVGAAAEPVLKTGNFITSPKYFNGFEKIKNDGTFFTGGAVYSEGGLTVTQYQADQGNDIWVTLGNTEGVRSWYPNGGDNGYTGITLTDGADFSEISFLFTSWGGGSLQYSLLNNGLEVLGGTYNASGGVLTRAGFSGGGFDQLLIRSGSEGSIGDTRTQALQLDSIKADALVVAVPEPGTFALLALGMAGLIARRRKALIA